MTTPPPRLASERAELHAALVRMFDHHIAFNQLLGLRTLSTTSGDIRAAFDMRPELVGHFAYGRLHGGVISAVLDALGGLALMAAMADKHPQDAVPQVMQRFVRMGTIDLRVDFLRQGLGQHFVASAEVLRLGSRVGSTQMRLHNDSGLLIATGAAAYVVT